MLSLIIPVFNEAPNLWPLYREINEVLARLHQAAEILIIDDASTDHTPEVIRELKSADSRIRGFRLQANSDKGGALVVGFAEARGEIFITLDGDLQNDPADIPLLLAALEAGADAALGWRSARADRPGKRFSSLLFNGITSLVFRCHFHDANTGFKAFRKDAVTSLPLMHGLFRFLSFILAARGAFVVEVPVRHRPRRSGTTKFRFWRRVLSLVQIPAALRANRALAGMQERPPAFKPL